MDLHHSHILKLCRIGFADQRVMVLKAPGRFKKILNCNLYGAGKSGQVIICNYMAPESLGT
jgi:hypothetical protein